MIVIDNASLNIAREKLGSSGVGRFSLSCNVFLEARDFLSANEYAIVQDHDEKELFALTNIVTNYFHSYNYTGELDLWLLNKYDCVIMRDCNEYAMELYLSALNQWSGSRIVFVGKNWEYFLGCMPQYENLDYYYEEELTAEAYLSLTEGKKAVNLIQGLPHLEGDERYRQNIVYYDEAMLLTFLFSDKRCLGQHNPDKKFLIIDPRYGNLGLFAFYNFAISYARYVKAKGYIPILSFKNNHGSLSIYQDFRGDDFWSKFFNQPEWCDIDDVMNSENVYFAPEAYNAGIIDNFMREIYADVELSWPEGICNDALRSYVAERESRFLPYPKKTLGVLARGTDFQKSGLHNHPIHATKEMIREKIDEMLGETGLEYIYIATEDASYCEYFKDIYGNRIFFTDQERFSVKDGELLADMHRKNQQKRSGFLLGAEYYLSILLLSRCDCLLASGKCSGTAQAISMNGGKYKCAYIFELGRHE